MIGIQKIVILNIKIKMFLTLTKCIQHSYCSAKNVILLGKLRSLYVHDILQDKIVRL